MNILNQTESAVFLYCRFSLFLKDPFFQVILINLYSIKRYLFEGYLILVFYSNNISCFVNFLLNFLNLSKLVIASCSDM